MPSFAAARAKRGDTARMNGLLWKAQRARAMDAHELVYRLRQAIQAQWEKKGFLLARYTEPVGEAGRAWAEEPGHSIDAARHTAAADDVLAGRFRLFGSTAMQLGFPPQWNRDPKTGTEAPLVFGKTLDYRDEALVGDIKYLWELNRHLELVTIAQAYHLTGDRRYADGSAALLESWFQQCPYPNGPNWTSSLELGFRLVNWAYAWHLLGGDASPVFDGGRGDALRCAWLESIHRHMHFIRGYLSRFSSSNNHLIGEYMGLFVGAAVWPLWGECREWRAFARRGIENEALRQNASDGVNREQAIWYAHTVADMLLHVGLIGRANGVELNNAYWACLEGILEHVASIMDVSGRVPMFGDSDDAVVVRFSQEQGFDVYRSLLATGAVLFERGEFKLKAAGFDDKSRWLLGSDAEARFNRMPVCVDRLPVRRAFPSGGHWILGDRFETRDETRLVADAGPLGYLSIAAHGHADALSFTLSVWGREILVDSGTFAFHTRKKWRDYFRGTSAHNTLRVDGRDQSVPGGNFLWLKHARAECHRFECGPDCDEWEASHDGYLRLADPVRHRRRIVLEKSTAAIEVVDMLECAGSHAVELFWHFAEGCSVVQEGSVFWIRHGKVTVKLLPPVELKAGLVRGRESPPLGWVSRRFDRKVPTTTLVCEGRVNATHSLHTSLKLATPSIGGD